MGRPDRPNAESASIESLTESIEHLGEAVAIVRVSGVPGSPPQFVHVNQGFVRLFGFDRADLDAATTERLFGPRTDHERLKWLRSRVEQGEPARIVVMLYGKDGSPLWTEISELPVRDPNAPGYQIATYRDVTSRKQFEDALASEKRKLQTTLASIADAVVTVLADGRVEFVNAAAERMLGIELVEAYGVHVAEVLRVEDGDGEPIDLAGAAAHEGVRRGSGHLRTNAGTTIDVGYVASAIDDEQHGTVIVLRDVTAETHATRKLSFEALHDPLTGLQNRRAFAERLEEAMSGARERGEHHALGFLDLDRFKVVNDRFGHAVGDRLLREIGEVMVRVVRGGDVLARIGGDEFA
ncbi:MAG TPA: diguanylate cyclase, partial [Candidatus Elarobacter sp.]|nr:diguanylate cyclase [Candidatus Elarobacter sp.]